MNLILDVFEWTMRATWRTWVGHAVLAVALASVVGTWAVIVFYLFRELEQIFTERFIMGFEDSDWVDHFMDFASPFVACALVNVIWGI